MDMRITWQGILFVISEGPNGTNKKQVVELGKMGPDFTKQFRKEENNLSGNMGNISAIQVW